VDACKTKERGNPGRAYKKLKALSQEPELTPRERVEILLPMAVCLRLLGRPHAADMLFRQLLVMLTPIEGEKAELRLRIILDWSAVLLDHRRMARRAIVNLEEEFAKLTEADELYWKTKAYLGRAYIRVGDAKGLVYLSEAMPHLQGSLQQDVQRWKLEANAAMWPEGKQERQAHYEEMYAFFRQKAPMLAVNVRVCYYTEFRLLRPISMLQGMVYVLKSVRPA